MKTKRIPRRAAAAVVATVLGAAALAGGAVAVTAERQPPAEAKPDLAFAKVPGPSAADAAQRATFTVVDGTPSRGTGGLDRLHDGRLPDNADAPTQNFYFEWGTLEGRVRVDLGRVVAVGQVNTYSWHKDTRAPQVYKVYGSDGTAAGFNPAPKNGADPARCGWTKIAAVDTRPRDGTPMGGREAVSLSDPSGTVGRYRYLLFEMFATETADPWGQTFYSEIDVVERK